MTGIPQELDLGVLLAEQAFVRRLARSLVLHETDAEDVAQQTWVAALRRPLREPVEARPFLARVAQRVASNWKRGEGRRRRREALADPPASAPSVDEVFARESLRQQVVAELAALAEPYRSTLVLRFFEDLAPQEIANRQGIPDGTVRARLKRGLEALRGRLDQRYGGDRSAWCTALLPLTELGRDGTPLAAVGAASLFGLHKLLWPALAVAALLATATWLGDDPAPQERQPDSTPPSASLATATGPAADASSASRTPAATRAPLPEAAAPATDAAPDNGLRGRLVLPDGSPAPGRNVQVLAVDVTRLFDGETGLAPSVPLADATTQSDGDGRFVVRDVRPRALLVLQAGRGTAHSACVPVPHTPGPGHVVDLGDVRLEARGTVQGRVEDEDGEPVEGAEVWVAGVPALVTLAVNVERFAPAHGGMLLLPEPQADEPARAFALRLRSHLGGTLFQETQDVEPGTRVHVLDTPPWFERLWRALPIARATTAADGSFRIEDVAPGACMLVARRAGLAVHVKAALKVTAGEERAVGTLVLRAGETCIGTVVDHEGAPVPGAAVRVAAVPAAGFRGLVFGEAEVVTDARGRFAVGGLGGGEVLVAARSGPGRPWTVAGPADVFEDVRVELPAPGELRIRIPRLAASAAVRLRHGPVCGELGRMGLAEAVDTTARLEVDGADDLRVRDLLPGTYLLEVEAPGHVARRLLVEAPGAVEVTLAPAAPPFEVQVVSATGRPLAGARVRCTPPVPDLAHAVLPTYFGVPDFDVLPRTLGCTDGDGLLRVSGLPSGTLELWADHPGHGRVLQRAELPAARVLLRLPRAASIRGVLTENGRTATPGKWRITVEPRQRGDGLNRPYALAAPAADGSFLVTGLEPGPQRILVQEALPERLDVPALVELLQSRVFSFFGSGEVRALDVVLQAGEEREVRLDTDLTHDPPAVRHRLTGRVLVDGAPGAGLTVRAAHALGSGGWGYTLDIPGARGKTDADGVFALEGCPEGVVDVIVDDGTGDRQTTLARREVSVAPNAANDVQLAVATGRVAGRVQAAEGRSVRGCVVRGTGPEGATFQVPVDEDGAFTTERIAAGRWLVGLEGPELIAPASVPSVDVAAGSTESGVVLQARPAFTVAVRVEGLVAGEKTFLMLRSENGQANWARQCDDEGVATFGPVAGGIYHVSIDAPRAMAGEIELSGPVRHEFVLSPQGVTRVR